MRSRTRTFLALLPAFGFVLLFPARGSAQGCVGVMTPEFSTYTSYSTDGVHIYSTVEVDGYTQIGNTEYCNISGAIHTPRIYNVLGSAGGWYSGPGVSPYDYINFSNSQEIAATPGTTYTESVEGRVVCSLIGDFYDTGLTAISIRIAVSNYTLMDWDASNCYYILACPNGNSHAFCGAGNTTFIGGVAKGCSNDNHLWVYYLVVNDECMGVGLEHLSDSNTSCQ